MARFRTAAPCESCGVEHIVLGEEPPQAGAVLITFACRSCAAGRVRAIVPAGSTAGRVIETGATGNPWRAFARPADS